jgi:hypothetical protein
VFTFGEATRGFMRTTLSRARFDGMQRKCLFSTYGSSTSSPNLLSPGYIGNQIRISDGSVNFSAWAWIAKPVWTFFPPSVRW